jgi:hypothetical protein
MKIRKLNIMEDYQQTILKLDCVREAIKLKTSEQTAVEFKDDGVIDLARELYNFISMR